MDNGLMRALVFGAVLAVGGIGLFLLLYFVVLSGLEQTMRLMGSLCTPPVVMLILVGGYYILTQDQDASA